MTDDTGENVMGTPRRQRFVPGGEMTPEEAERLRKRFLDTVARAHGAPPMVLNMRPVRDVRVEFRVDRARWPWCRAYAAVHVDGRRVWARRRRCLTGHMVHALTMQMMAHAQRWQAGVTDDEEQR